jgi:hypothetical protein
VRNYREGCGKWFHKCSQRRKKAQKHKLNSVCAILVVKQYTYLDGPPDDQAGLGLWAEYAIAHTSRTAHMGS